MATENTSTAAPLETNHALVIHGAQSCHWEPVPMPVPEEHQVLLRVAYVGICGSDLHYYRDGANGDFQVREPLIPGHELSATVAEDPTGELRAGTPVTVHPARWGTPQPGLEDAPNLWPGGSYLGSASTWPHTQGALAEFIVVDRTMLRVLPEQLPIRRAVLAEPLAVALHAVEQARSVGAHPETARILVSGVGPIGLLTVAALKAAGAAHITATDVVPQALERAERQGATVCLDVSKENVPERSYDLVFECSGVDAAIASSTSRALRSGGVHVQVGMVSATSSPIGLSRVISGEIRIVGAFRFVHEIDDAIRLLESHSAIEDVITHELDPKDPGPLFATAADPRLSGKVIVGVTGTPRP
ncbi:zinc-binding dehydrogenase [Nesterenkonia jeotgali]|uniref:L-idonate 5-dehydrogenase n=1 Tax=Nesterenkonia jeotgali TaxID=317018 RepID=A0A839FRX6_9MICC|nr:zinc-binding dehydrogenase [Nesterenkonia jeotgali]MBA8920673.1 L-idonate 5-dehydrogenase [Nesterenkonia jeotgali]